MSHGRGSGRKGMSTAAKVALATTAGAAVGATAAGLATSKKGRALRQKVTRKVKDLVNQGSITLKNSGIIEVVEEFEHLIGGMLSTARGGRRENTMDRTRSDETGPLMRGRARRPMSSHRSR